MIKFFLPLSLALFTLFGSVNCSYAQTKEEREFLKSLQNEKEINVILDMSRASIHGYSESDFVYREDLQSDKDWATLWETEYKPDLLNKFLGSFNLMLFDFGYTVKFGDFKNSKYQLRIQVIKVLSGGSTAVELSIEDREQLELIYLFKIDGLGGKYGSKVNLMGDGFTRAGRVAARKFHKFFK
ncbi:MAG: hypothetical protein PHS38_15685 [Bacteroidales bacterium]|nr:hypothetical protein [Bacteroidales bacterium]